MPATLRAFFKRRRECSRSMTHCAMERGAVGSMSDGFFLGLQTDFDLMERRRAIGADLAAIEPRAA